MPLLLLVLVAAVQGLTEFLPVSSSGHLALIPLVTDQPYQGRAIDVAAHVGTLGAVLLYFRHDLTAILLALRPGRTEEGAAQQRQMIRLLIIATVPVFAVGFVVNEIDPAWLTDIRTLAAANLVFAALLWHADRTESAAGNGTSLWSVVVEDISPDYAQVVGNEDRCELRARYHLDIRVTRVLGNVVTHQFFDNWI